MNKILRKEMAVVIVGLLMVFTAPVQAQEQKLNFEVVSQAESETFTVALDGFDVVSYFYSPSPQKGNKAHQAIYLGKRYLFVSAENQKKFAAAPEEYLPEFEEYCGCAVSEGEHVKADPEVFKIVEGSLVLFEDANALSTWNKNEEERYEKAQNFWEYESEYNANDRLQDDTRVRLFSF